MYYKNVWLVHYIQSLLKPHDSFCGENRPKWCFYTLKIFSFLLKPWNLIWIYDQIHICVQKWCPDTLSQVISWPKRGSGLYIKKKTLARVISIYLWGQVDMRGALAGCVFFNAFQGCFLFVLIRKYWKFSYFCFSKRFVLTGS